MRFNRYLMVYQIIDMIHCAADVHALNDHIRTTPAPQFDDVMRGHIRACIEALEVYEQGYFHRWSTPFLQSKLEECRKNADDRNAAVYESELRNRPIL